MVVDTFAGNGEESLYEVANVLRPNLPLRSGEVETTQVERLVPDEADCRDAVFETQMHHRHVALCLEHAKNGV